jgi:NitT/TauT family transport system substrate-binding protein
MPLLRAFVPLILLLLAGPVNAQTSASSQKVTVATSGRAVMGFLPVTLAERLGYFRDAGLDVEFFDFAGGSKSIEALVGGSVDLMTGAYEHTLLLQRRGVHPQCLVLLSHSYGAVIAVAKARAATYRGPRDLKGMVIGVSAPGSAMALTLEIFLKKHGMTVDDVSIVGVGQGSAAVAAVRTGKLDAIANPDPVISVLLKEGSIVPIIDTRTVQGTQELYGGSIAASAINAMPSFVARRPEAAQAFVTAIVRALRWLKSASLEEIVAAVPASFYENNVDVYTQSLASFRENFSAEGRVTPELQRNTLAMVRMGPLSESEPVDLSSTYSGQFVEKANAAIGPSR